jgi:ferredoxin
MCEFCTQHGEGKVWYLEARNHSRETMHRLGVEERHQSHSGSFEDSIIRLYTLYDKLSPLWRRVGWLKRAGHDWAVRKYKKKHYGQIVPREHVHRIFEMTQSIVRLPCTCRRFVRGKPEARYCFGLGLGPAGYRESDPFRADLEVLTPAEAAALTDACQRDENLIHTVWTMPTPFVATICNCSHRDCGALFTTYRMGIEVLFPGEHKAVVSDARCRRCNRCVTACPFGAITPGRGRLPAAVLPQLCQGCGLCRQACPDGALRLAGLDGHHAGDHDRDGTHGPPHLP